MRRECGYLDRHFLEFGDDKARFSIYWQWRVTRRAECGMMAAS